MIIKWHIGKWKQLYTKKLWFCKGHNTVDWWYLNVIIMTQNESFEQLNIRFKSWELPIIKKSIRNAGADVEKGNLSYTVGRNVSWCSYSGEQYGSSLEN